MGESLPHPPVSLLLAAFSRHDAALDWAKTQAAEAWGPVALESPRFDFTETGYYDATMGTGLEEGVLRLRAAVRSGGAGRNQAGDEPLGGGVRRRGPDLPEPRPLNLDPGYLTPAKLVLASTKDFAHRIYLSRGIYAEITLQYRHHRWQHHEYTFPDYRRADYQEFFEKCRQWQRRKMMNAE